VSRDTSNRNNGYGGQNREQGHDREERDMVRAIRLGDGALPPRHRITNNGPVIFRGNQIFSGSTYAKTTRKYARSILRPYYFRHFWRSRNLKALPKRLRNH